MDKIEPALILLTAFSLAAAVWIFLVQFTTESTYAQQRERYEYCVGQGTDKKACYLLEF